MAKFNIPTSTNECFNQAGNLQGGETVHFD